MERAAKQPHLPVALLYREFTTDVNYTEPNDYRSPFAPSPMRSSVWRIRPDADCSRASCKWPPAQMPRDRAVGFSRVPDSGTERDRHVRKSRCGRRRDRGFHQKIKPMNARGIGRAHMRAPVIAQTSEQRHVTWRKKNAVRECSHTVRISAVPDRATRDGYGFANTSLANGSVDGPATQPSARTKHRAPIATR